MMSISRLSAGDGYAYYTSVTARGDQARGNHEIGDYYLDTGTPQGQWIGGGAATLEVTGDVTEQQMKALFGEGLHPNADQLIANKISDGTAPKTAIDQVRLGRKFARFESPDNELRTAIDTAIQAETKRLGAPLSPDQRTRVRMRQAGILFRERNGRSGSPHEVAKFLSTELGRGQNAVAGFDLTFSAPKSLSLAWSTANDQHAKLLEDAHTRAIESTIKWMESEVIRARSGAGGIALHKTSGLVGTRFRHWESREGDPQLHDHVVIANRVQITEQNGTTRWLTIDSRGLYKATMNASSVYNRVLADELKTLGFELRTRRTGNHTGVELACISDQQIERFSSRSIAVQARTNELVADYVAKHGRQPATKELLQLKQQATLETRVPKSQAVTRDQLRQRWTNQLAFEHIVIQQDVRNVLDAPPGRTHEPPTPAADDTSTVAAQIIDELSAKQSTWNRNHVQTRVNIWAAQQPRVVTQTELDTITHKALNEAGFCINPPLDLPAHPEITNRDGTSIYQSPAGLLYTSPKVLEAEDRLLQAAHDVALPSTSQQHFNAALHAYTGPLDQGQIDLARQVACSEQLLTVGIGPAGAGKTSAMRLAINAAHRAGVDVHGITVSAAAAEQLERSTHASSTTIAKWLHDTSTGRRTINTGDIILVDEAGMASARDLAAITEQAYHAGAFVRLIGDDRQLQAIGAGGSLKMLASEVGAVHLDQVHRFHNPEEATASLALRNDGDTTWYEQAQRVHGGSEATTLTRVVDGWLTDERSGSTSLMMASTNRTVAVLNQLAQEARIDAGEVDQHQMIPLADGNHAGVGDRIVTRRNDRRLTTQTGHGFVKNGDLWTITAITESGAVQVQDTHNRTVTLPADYVQHSTGLGYASTVHRAQGQTVDVARLIIDDTTSREALYVGVTRGRERNEVHAITQGRSATEMLRRAANNVTQASSARELIQQAQEETSHPAHLVRILHDMQARADRHRYTATIRALLPQHAHTLLTSDKQATLFAALTRAENAGFTPTTVLNNAVVDLPETPDPTGLIAWRIDMHLQRAAAQAAQHPRRPLRHLPDHRLDQLLERATQQHRVARNVRAATLKDGATIPAWTDRPHGHYSDAALATRIHQQREQTTTVSRAIRETQRHARDLKQQLRRATNPNYHSALQRRLDRLDARISRLQHERRTLLRTQEELRTETRLRAHLTPASWGMEQHQRRQPNLHRQALPDRAERTQVVQRELWLEHHRRQYDPDRPLTPHRQLPQWAIATRGTTDPRMPQSWQQPLHQMRDIVAAAITARGAEIALNPPPWATRYLGPVPAAGSRSRARWEAVAGNIDTLRTLTGHTDPGKALPTPKQAKPVLGREATKQIHSLHTAASDLRRGMEPPNQALRHAATQPAPYRQPERAPQQTAIQTLTRATQQRRTQTPRIEQPQRTPTPAPDQQATTLKQQMQASYERQHAAERTAKSLIDVLRVRANETEYRRKLQQPQQQQPATPRRTIQREAPER